MSSCQAVPDRGTGIALLSTLTWMDSVRSDIVFLPRLQSFSGHGETVAWGWPFSGGKASMTICQRKKATRRLRFYVLASLLGVVFMGGANPPDTPPSSPPPNPGPAGAASPLDEPLRLIDEARKSYQNVRDYSCLLVKRERIEGQLQPDNVIAMKVRSRPFSVYLHWKAPRDMTGQEVCYVEGRNNGQMRVHSQGVLGVVGFVSLAPDDARGQKNSRHLITEAGIGNLIERFAGYYEMERRVNLTQVRIGHYDYNKRKCIRVETIHPDNRGGQFHTYRSILYFDKETHLPIRIECYDWPKQSGSADGDLIEVYSYADLRLNAGVADEVFDH